MKLPKIPNGKDDIQIIALSALLGLLIIFTVTYYFSDDRLSVPESRDLIVSQDLNGVNPAMYWINANQPSK